MRMNWLMNISLKNRKAMQREDGMRFLTTGKVKILLTTVEIVLEITGIGEIPITQVQVTGNIIYCKMQGE